jgi:hypothetical protein
MAQSDSSKRPLEVLWWSQDGRNNAAKLHANHPNAFVALAELDALGHLILQRAAAAQREAGIEALVGLSMLRRAVTHFVGIRHLMEASAVEQSKLLIRAQFETMLAFRYLVHGARKSVALETPASKRQREIRARYFLVAARRREVYAIQAALAGRSGLKPRRANVAAMLEESREISEMLDRELPTQSAAFGPYAYLNPVPHKRRYHDVKEWFSFGFRRHRVNSVRQLATRLGQLWEYEVLYDAFSGLIHPRGISHDVMIADNQLQIFSPYMADAFQLLCKWSCSWQGFILAWAVKAYHPASLGDAQAVTKKVSPLLDTLSTALPPGLL